MSKHMEFLPVVVEHILTNKEWEAFLGGSRRFGYWSEDSDWDLFVFARDQRALVDFLEQNGFVAHGDNYALGTFNFVLYKSGGMPFIHVNICESKRIFEGLKEEHDKVDDLLLDGRFLKFARHLCSYVDGKTTYRLLLNLAEIVQSRKEEKNGCINSEKQVEEQRVD